MLQPISSLSLSDMLTSKLKDNGFFFVEDIKNESESTTNFSDAIEEAQKFCKVPQSISALDMLQEELRREKITTLSRDLDTILDGGFQCKTVTELCGAPGSGKTQICLQLCINIQLNKNDNGLDGEALYIDTRGGMMTTRLIGKKENAICGVNLFI